LVASPGALIADGERASIDDQMRGDSRSIGNDLTRLFLPLHYRIAERTARTGRLPLWDPSGFGGRPLLGNPQAGLFYPPVWLAWRVKATSALGWLTVAHLVWGALGAYLLGRYVGLGELAASVAAGCFATFPYMLGQTYEGHYPHVWAASWYPWAFWTFLRWRQEGQVSAALWLPPILALASLTGHPQECYYLVLTLTTWILVEVLWQGQFGTFLHRAANRRSPSSGGRGRPIVGHAPGRLLIGWVVIVSVFAGLVAVELLPDLKCQAWALRGTRFTMREASRYHVNPLNLLQLLDPGALGLPADYFGHDNYWETVLSVGLIPLVFIVTAWVCSPQRAVVRTWVSLLVITLLFAAGRRYGVFAVFYEIVPGMNCFRVPARALFLTNLAAAILAGLGLDAIAHLDSATMARTFAKVALAVIGILFIAQCVAWWLGVGHDTPSLYTTGEGDGHWNRFRELGRWLRGCAVVVHDPAFWICLSSVGVALCWSRACEARRQRLALILGILAVAELVYYGGYRLLRVSAVEQFLGDDLIARAIPCVRSTGSFRIRARDAVYADLPAVVRGYEKTNVNDYFQIQHSAHLYEHLYPLFGPVRPRESFDLSTRREAQSLRHAVLD
jgi:hypothetical protein